MRSGRKSQSRLWCWRGSSGSPQILPRTVLLPPQPYFRAELGGVVNIESLIEFSREIGDRGELDAEAVRDHRFCFAKRELNADFHLRRRSTIFPKRTRRMGNGVFVECDRHRYEAGLWILGGVLRKDARGHKPFSSSVITP